MRIFANLKYENEVKHKLGIALPPIKKKVAILALKRAPTPIKNMNAAILSRQFDKMLELIIA